MFNPNVALELGYMYALRRRCLLLKDQRMKSLPNDVTGKLFRASDTYDIKTSVSREVRAWLGKDLRLEDPTIESWGVLKGEF